jgi:hypothetical protein
MNMQCTAPRRTHDSKHGVAPVKDNEANRESSHRFDSQNERTQPCKPRATEWHAYRQAITNGLLASQIPRCLTTIGFSEERPEENSPRDSSPQRGDARAALESA